MTVAVVITGASVMIFLTASIVASYPNLAVVPVALIGAAIATVMPVLTYPLTQTIWSAFDLRVHPPMANEFCESTPVEFLPVISTTTPKHRDVAATTMWATSLNADVSPSRPRA